MRASLFSAIVVLLVFFSCEYLEKNGDEKLVKRKVYQIPFPETRIASKKAKKLVPDTSYLDVLFRQRGFVSIQELDSSIHIQLRYADTANFLHTSFYDGLKTAYFNCETAIRLANAQYFLKRIYPGYSLLILDASRPLHIQQMMWDSLDMPALKKYQYLSPPSEPSLHNYGCAVDLCILDVDSNKILDMGTGFDEFTKLSEPSMEKEFLRSGKLSMLAYRNRLLLRAVMEAAKFKGIATEWWHFSICTKPEAQKRFELIY